MRKVLISAALAALVAVCLAVPAGAQGFAAPWGCSVNGWPCWMAMPAAGDDAKALTYSATLRQAIWSSVTETDGVIGNEILNTTDTTLTRSGSGTAGSPYTLALTDSATAGYYMVSGGAEGTPTWSSVLKTDGTTLASGNSAPSASYQLYLDGYTSRGGLIATTAKNGSTAVWAQGVGTVNPTLTVSNRAAVSGGIRPAMEIVGPVTGTGAVGDGLGAYFRLRSTTTSNVTAGALETSWVDPTHAAPRAKLALSVYDTAQRVGLDIRSTGTQADLYTYGNQTATTASGGTRTLGFAVEEITLSTTGLTTDSSADLLPAGAVIEAVTARVTEAITNVTDWAVGDPTTSARFISPTATLTLGTTAVGLNHQQGSISSDAAGPVQTSAAKVRITCTTAGSNPSAGKIRVTVWYRSYTADST